MFATGTKGLLIWCKQITSYYGEEVAVKNMTTSFKNGMAFCAILHHYRPDLIDFPSLSKENIAENNALAFRVAEEELDIPALLDVEDMVEMKIPDKLSIMTYVSQYYNYFKDKTPGEIEKKKYGSKKRALAKDDQNESVPNKKSNDSPKEASLKQKQNSCCLCNQKVFLMERMTVESKLFHRICFKCCVCDIQLKTSTYEYDRNEGLFYCSKDFEDRNKGAVRQEPIGSDSSHNSNTSSPLDNISEDFSEIPSISNNPFKRNEQFVRKGIRPQSSPADIDWEKPKVIKSKQDERKAEKPASKIKISFPGLKKNKKEKEMTKFSNPSYQQQLELSKFMHELDAQNQSERVVIGSESQISHVEKSSTLSGVLASPPKSPIQKFSGAVELDNENSNTISGKSQKKKKLVLKVKKKFKNKKSKDVVDGEVIEASHDELEKNEVKNNVYTEVLKDDVNVENASPVYENKSNFQDAEKSKADDDDSIIYDNNKLCKIIGENESEVCENKTKENIPSNESNLNNERHYDKPMNVLITANCTASTPSGDGKSVESGYQEVRSNLRKVDQRDSTTKTTGDKTIVQSFLQVRANLRRSCVDLSVDSAEATESQLASKGETYVETKDTLYHMDILENEMNKENIIDELSNDVKKETSIEKTCDSLNTSHGNLATGNPEGNEMVTHVLCQSPDSEIRDNETVQGEIHTEKMIISDAEEEERGHYDSAVREIEVIADRDENIEPVGDKDSDELRMPKGSVEDLDQVSTGSQNSLKEVEYFQENERKDGFRMEVDESITDEATTEEKADKPIGSKTSIKRETENEIDNTELNVETPFSRQIKDEELIKMDENEVEEKTDGIDVDDEDEDMMEPSSRSWMVQNPDKEDSKEKKDIEDASYPSTIMNTVATQQLKKKEPSSNPFEDSEDDDETEIVNTTELKELNPFLTSSDDEVVGYDSFEDSNPFADDARVERKSMREGKTSFQRRTAERLSLKDRTRLEQIGIEESNPFAEDLLEGADDEHTFSLPVVTSNITSSQGQKRDYKVKAPPPPTSVALIASNQAVVKPKFKKRAAPKAPPRPVSAPVIDHQFSLRRSFKKRAAPRPPSQQVTEKKTNDVTNDEITSPLKPPRREPGKQILPPKGIEYANVQFEEGKITLGIDVIRDEDRTTSEVDASFTNLSKETVEDSDTSENRLKDDVCEEVSIVDTFIEEEPTVNKSFDEIAQANPAQDHNEEGESVSDLPLTVVENNLPSRQLSEKRKAPNRPPPPQRMESLNENKIQSNIALRDKQPRRQEIELELKQIEAKQLELEKEGVTMEKKLREFDSEPEDAYLLTWFELVNQKNQLLRRENELIYMCQELDFLQNQRHAEFELRQLMMKTEHEKTESDRDREEELLTEILKLVTMRSNIVDRMDEDRLREYEEDEEVQHMIEEQGLSHRTPDAKENKPQTEPKGKREKKKKEKERKEKLKKKKK